MLWLVQTLYTSRFTNYAMSKHIAIIGGGISGLALLHYLEPGRGDHEVVLFEKNEHLGGTIRSMARNGCLF